MSDGADVSYVISTGVQGTGMLLQGTAQMVKGLICLIQFLNAQYKKGKLTQGEFKSITQLIKASDGNINYLNIPAENEQYVEQIKEDLRKMNVPFHVLPDLNSSDGMMQIVYHGAYKNLVMPWLQDYCTNRLQEGSLKDDRTLTALAGGKNQTGILTIPTEDRIQLHEMLEDFSKMGVSFTLMEDTNVGDGTREILYAKQDEEKIKSWLENFCQKHVVKGGEKNYQELQNLAGSKAQVGFISIPAKNKEVILESMKEDFSMLGINYHIMPMQAGSGQTQVLYLKKDETAIRNWYSSYATDQLVKGGQKSYLDLINLTNGQTQMVNVAVSEETLGDMKADFDALHINYTMLPDLNVSDGKTQILYAAADAAKVTSWYQLYQEKLLKETGEKLPDMEPLNMEQYAQTASLTPEEYLNEAQKQAEVPEREPVKKNIPFHENPYFQHYDAMPEYEKITIHEKLVIAKENGTFVSRIPNSENEYLVCNDNLVFESDFETGGADHNKTYLAFISKNHRNIIVDEKGNRIASKSTKELLEHYDKVTRDFGKQRVQELAQTPKIPKPAKK